VTVGLDVDAVVIRQRRWWRHTAHRADPLAGRVPPPDGRWQHGAVVAALYLASDDATVWAEWYRHLAELGVPPNQQMPRDLWTWAVDPGLEVADLGSDQRLKRVGLAVPHPGRRTWSPYQKVGEHLWREGWPGLVAPSAARPRDGLVLCLFRDAQRPRQARPLPPPRVVRQPPAPPEGMNT
jgi:RES domain-containing protein